MSTAVFGPLPFLSGLTTSPTFIASVAMMMGFLLNNFMTSFHTMDVVQDRKKFFNDIEYTFDFIIVGGGSAGCAVAGRLAENPDFKILVLEAGGEPNPLFDIPLVGGFLMNRQIGDWLYKSVPQKKACLLTQNGVVSMTRGKCLGGSGSVNGIMYFRGHGHDYDNWANITGDERWSYKNVLPVFKQIEDYTGKYDNEEYHGRGGRLSVKDYSNSELANIFIKAGKEFGYAETDPNSQFNEGFSRMVTNQKNGRRHSPYKSFLKPVMGQSNVFVYKFAHVTQILFDGPSNRAVGVSYVRHGHKKVAYATKEVILSAGALSTPQILMLSGIGPKDQLNKFEIPVRANRPGVGQHLMDHVGVMLGPFIIDRPLSFKLNRDLFPEALTQYLMNGEGPIQAFFGSEANAFVTSSLSTRKNWPDLQFVVIRTSVGPVELAELARSLQFSPGSLNSMYEKSFDKDSFIIAQILTRPLSRGEARLQSKDPMIPLQFNPNFLDELEDVSKLVEAVKLTIKLVEGSEAFKEIGGRFTKSKLTKCAGEKQGSDKYYECLVRHLSTTIWHYCGTATMGRVEDKMAVVDSQLRVIGTKGLRVIDASIMPEIVSSNTNAPAILIGEMGARFIKTEYESNNGIDSRKL